MTIKVIKAFAGVPDGETHPRQFVPGDVIEGDLARVALAEKWAKDTSKAKEPPPAGPGGEQSPPPAA